MNNSKETRKDHDNNSNPKNKLDNAHQDERNYQADNKDEAKANNVQDNLERDAKQSDDQKGFSTQKVNQKDDRVARETTTNRRENQKITDRDYETDGVRKSDANYQNDTSRRD